MEKKQVKLETKTVEVVTHYFYCDKCGKEIASEEEDDYGEYEGPDSYNQTVILGGVGYYELNMLLCEDCKKIINNKIRNTLLECGFREDKYNSTNDSSAIQVN